MKVENIQTVLGFDGFIIDNNNLFGRICQGILPSRPEKIDAMSEMRTNYGEESNDNAGSLRFADRFGVVCSCPD